MIDLNYIKNFFPPQIASNPLFAKQMLKEYLLLMILDYISSLEYVRQLTFIGGTNLRLIKKIDRFSEDLDFDCKNLSKDDFITLTDNIIRYLQGNGLNAVVKQKESERITAFRRSIYFPELLFTLKLSGHKEERLLVKIEAEDQCVGYKPQVVNVSGCGFFFPLQVPPDDILCAMKVSALLSRCKGRDFYDCMFLLSQVSPNMDFLQKRNGIKDRRSLKRELLKVANSVDLNMKKRDFEHLLFNAHSSEKILQFKEFVESRL